MHFKLIIHEVVHLFNPMNKNGFKSSSSSTLHFTLMSEVKLSLDLVCSLISLFSAFTQVTQGTTIFC